MTMRLISLFSVEFFSRILPINFVGEPLCVSEPLGHRKLLCSVRGVAVFRWFFGLPVLKIFVGNHFNLTGNFGYRNFLCMRTEKLVFPPKFLCLTIPKKFVVTTSKFQIIWDLENSLSYHDFPSKFLSHITEKLREEPSSVSEIFKREVTKKVMNKNGISRFSVVGFLSQGAEKFR